MLTPWEFSFTITHKGVVFVNHTLLVCRSVFRTQFEKEIFIGDDDILALVESGSFTFDNGSGMQTVGPLEAVSFKQGVRYERHIIQTAQMYFFRYRATVDLFGNGKVTFKDTERIRSTLRLLELSDATIQPDDFACKQTLFADIVNQYRLENAVQESAQTDPVVLAAIAYFNANLQFKLNLSRLAAQHYLSYVQFSRRFKATTGSTPQGYLTALRLKRAQTLLTESSLAINQIAKNCGFSNEYYFSNFFRKHCQLSPTQYRAIVQDTDATT